MRLHSIASGLRALNNINGLTQLPAGLVENQNLVGVTDNRIPTVTFGKRTGRNTGGQGDLIRQSYPARREADDKQRDDH